MKYLTCLALSLSAIFGVQAQNEVTMVLGTYTYGGSHGLYSYRFNQLTGEAVVLDSLSLCNPSYLTFSDNGKYLYAVSETHDADASLNTIAIDAQNGKMKLLGTVLTEGEDPCYVAARGGVALSANYSGGSMSVFQLSTKGDRAVLSRRFMGSIGGPDMTRQQTSHVHCACFTPDGRYILATDFSADRILSFRLHGANVTANGVATDVSADSGPRHLTFSPDGRFAYIMSELSGKVTVCRYREGRLQVLQEIVSDSLGARGGADIHLSPDGRFLYASNRLKGDGISIFRVDQQTGQLTKTGYQPTGIHPRHFNITPNGRYLLCCCRDSDKMQVFRRDEQTGLLTYTHQDIAVSKVVCVQFHTLR